MNKELLLNVGQAAAPEERLHYIVSRLQDGATVKEIAAELSLSRQRLHRIIAAADVISRYPISRPCCRCGKQFHLSRPGQKGCSTTCKKPILTHEERSARAKEALNRPEVREKLKQCFSDPQHRARLSKLAKERWASPEYRQKNKGRGSRLSGDQTKRRIRYLVQSTA